MPSVPNSIFTPKPILRTINSRVGLGTVIHRTLQPVANAIGMGGCAGCRRRARKLDNMFPNINPLAK